MEMLMTIEMGQAQACHLKTRDLRPNLPLYLFPVDPPANSAPAKISTCPWKSSCLINEGGYEFSFRDGSLFH
jgi:hypothetical protein